MEQVEPKKLERIEKRSEGRKKRREIGRTGGERDVGQCARQPPTPNKSP